jgi:transcriptional regulator with PAS, ATPase and Fis domain
VVGASPKLRDAVTLARCVAASPLTTVLLQGETGTGKELFARGIHGAGRPAGEPFVAINCAAIPQHLIETELFGHERGAFTGAIGKRGLLDHAATGTLFLDEIQQLPMELQAKLLRMVEDRSFRPIGGTAERPVNCRIVAGANVNLEDAVRTGRFREDLFFRLNVFTIELPPLRERRDDIVPLAEHFLREIAGRQGRPPKTLHERTCDLLVTHTWPGNAREVRNVMERASLLATSEVVHPAHLRLQRRETVAFGDACAAVGHITIPSNGKSLDTIEREAIRLTMILTEGNVSAASRILGITRPTLLRKMRDSGITRRSLLASS